jgi:thioredoxin-related protein
MSRMLLTGWGLIVIASLPALAADSKTFEQRGEAAHAAYQELLDRGREKSNRVPIVELREVFDEHYQDYLDRDISGFSEAELLGLHDALGTLLFYAQDADMARLMANVSNAIERRFPQSTSGHLEKTFEYLVETRLFEQARDFAKLHNEKLDAEAFVVRDDIGKDLDGPSVFTVRAENGVATLSRKAIELDKGNWVIVESEPRCYFSRKFLEYLEANKELREKFAGESLWLMRQGATVPLGPIVKWNEEADFVELTVSYNDDEWPREITLTATPTFSFVKEGKVIHQARGWLGEESLPELARGFELLEAGE